MIDPAAWQVHARMVMVEILLLLNMVTVYRTCRCIAEEGLPALSIRVEFNPNITAAEK